MSILQYGSMNLEIFCDGSGKGGYGFTVSSASGNVLHEFSGKVQNPTNNITEYLAVIKALEWAKSKTHGKISVFTDSQLVVSQVSGTWRCKKEHLIPLMKKAKQLVSETGAMLAWIPRAQNKRADELSREGNAHESYT